MIERPPSFAGEYQDEWSLYVVAHGLPEVPDDLVLGEAVPVSRWIGSSTAAVLHIRRLQWDETEAPENETDVQLVRLSDGVWEVVGSGGGGWKPDAPLAPMDLPSREVYLHGMTAGGGVTALWGEVGSEAAYTEIEQDSRVTRHEIEAPIGALVLCAETDQVFTVRVYDHFGGLMSEVVESGPRSWGLPQPPYG